MFIFSLGLGRLCITNRTHIALFRRVTLISMLIVQTSAKQNTTSIGKINFSYKATGVEGD